MEPKRQRNRLKDYPSKRLFKSDFCEWFSHIHPITPLAFWGPVIVYLYYRSSAVLELPVGQILSLTGLGLFIWTFTEYTLHRFVFHFNFPGELGKQIYRMIHGIHHEDPNDPTRLVMPLFASVILAVLLYSLFQWILGPVMVQPFFASFLIGYLCYDYTHYYVHHFKPLTRWGKLLKQSHMNHHYVSPNSRWGVSTPFWDYIFGTLEEPAKAKPTSESAAH